MDDYFEFSQKIRSELEGNLGLMERLEKHLSLSDDCEVIGNGSMHIVYRLGQLDSGLGVAIREVNLPHYYRPSKTILSQYESYCITAEYLSDRGIRLPRFCIGAFGKENAVLLLEDLTEGGTREITSEPGDQYGIYTDTNERVLVDLEDLEDLDIYGSEYDTLRYMNQENSIVFD